MIRGKEFIVTVVGSRKASMDHCVALDQYSTALLEMGAKIRSGCAPGPDMAATVAIKRYCDEVGETEGNVGELYLPDEVFNGFRDGSLDGACRYVKDKDIINTAQLIARIARGGFLWP